MCSATHKRTDSAPRSPWPQTRRDSQGGQRTKRRVKNWFDEWTAKKDRLEDQRKRQLDSIKDSVRDIAGKEWDVLTNSCRDDDSDTSDEEGFDIESDLLNDAADEMEKVPEARSRSSKLPQDKDRKGQ
jgi:hypothetical protein